MVFAQKKDGTVQFCVDYRRLNAVSKQDWYLKLCMHDCIDYLDIATLFSTVDANDGCWQEESDAKDRDKTAFTAHIGLYWFIRMPCGSRNAPGTF